MHLQMKDLCHNECCMRWLRLLAPYFAVGIFWVGFSHGWLAILVYHVQILFWHRFGRWIRVRKQENRIAQCATVACVLAGPVVYYLLPHIALVDLAQWLAYYRLDGAAFFLMIPYFGIVHPVLEQLHWHRLRSETGWAHIAFAGYHVVVLSRLLPVAWLVLVCLVLIAVSWLWKRTGSSVRGRWVCACSHMVADVGVMLAVLWLVYS